MKLFNRLTYSTVFIATLLMGHTTWATTYYVDRQLPGKDSNNGTSETTPFLTISKCVTVVTAGDTCLVKNGNYPEPWALTRSGSPGSPITIKNFTGHKPTITMATPITTANQLAVKAAGGINQPIGWIVIEGFDISNAYFALHLYSVHDFVVRKNRVHNSQRSAILGYGKDVTIEQNTVYTNGDFAHCATDGAWCNQDHGLYVGGTNWTIKNNLIYDNLSYGIQINGMSFDPSVMPDSTYSGAQNWLIANNTFAYQRYRAGIVVWNHGGTTANNMIINNIFYENCQQATTPTGSSACVTGSAGSGIDFSGPSLITVKNNLMYANTPGSTTFTLGTCYSCSISDNSTTSPNMTNAPSTIPSTPDFSLQSNSPAIDAGLTISSVTVDYFGAPRPTGSAFDVGAYEYGASLTNSPNAPRNLRVF